jgi:hypothetical protein
MQFFVGRGADVHLNRLPVDRICQIDFYRPHGMRTEGMGLRRDGKLVTWSLSEGDNFMEWPLKKKIIKIAGGTFHALLLFQDGTVDGLGNELGFSGFRNLKDVVDVAAGHDCSIACTKDGKVYATGQNRGNYVAFDSNDDIIEGVFQIPGLENIRHVGITSGQTYYAVDASGYLYFWDTQTHIKGVGFQKIPEKAKAILTDGFYLSQDLNIRWRPDYEQNKKTGAFLDWEANPALEGALHPYQSGNYGLAIKKDGRVTMYALEEQRKGRFVGHVIVSEQIIPDLKVDMSYYK